MQSPLVFVSLQLVALAADNGGAPGLPVGATFRADDQLGVEAGPTRLGCRLAVRGKRVVLEHPRRGGRITRARTQ